MFGEIIQFVPHIVGYGFTVLLSLLVGYHLREKRHEVSLNAEIANFEEGCAGLRAINQENLKIERAVQRELEISVLKCGESIEKMAQELEAEKKRADYNNKFREAIISRMINFQCWAFEVHGDDPEKMLTELIVEAQNEALDPTLFKRAKNLYVRGVRAGAKKGRTQMAKLMQKSIDNQAATIESYTQSWVAETKRFVRYKQAVQATINDKIGLPGVRRAFYAALEQDFALRNDLAKFSEDTSKYKGE